MEVNSHRPSRQWKKASRHSNMSRDLNKVMLIGRLGQDPEIRYTQDNTPVATLSVATSYPVKRGDSWDEETEWHRVVAWRRLAEVASEYMNKGTLVYVEGRLQTRSWEDRDGNKRWTTEIIARDISMLGGRSQRMGQDMAENGVNSQNPAPVEPRIASPPDTEVEDDVPI